MSFSEPLPAFGPSAGPSNLLDRGGFPSKPLTSMQTQVEGLVGGFIQQAADWRSLAAMTAGGLAYRVGRIGAMGLGGGNAVRAVSIGLGLTAEISAFEVTNRAFISNSKSEIPNLWRWSGSGGIAQGLLHSFISFGTLKGVGRLAQGQNLIAQHLLQDTAMVAGHQASGIFGLAMRPTGSLAEQFLHAEATNLQIGAGMALAHRFAPGVHGLERGLDLSLRTVDAGAGSPRLLFGSDRTGEEISPLKNGLQPVLAVAGERLPGLDPSDFILAMSAPKDRGGKGSRSASGGAKTSKKASQDEGLKILEGASAQVRSSEDFSHTIDLLSKTLLQVYPGLSAADQAFVDRKVNQFLRSANSNLFLLGAALLGRTLPHRKDVKSLKDSALLIAKHLSPALPMRGGVTTILKDVVKKMSVGGRTEFVEDILRIYSTKPRDAFEIFKETIPAMSRDDQLSVTRLILNRWENLPPLLITDHLRASVGGLVQPQAPTTKLVLRPPRRPRRK